MSSLLVIVGWYVVGFLVAQRLVGAGHSPVVWWTSAALLGACVVIPAAFAVVWRRRTTGGLDVVHRSGRRATDLHVMAVAPVEHLCGTLDAVPPTIGARTDAVSLAATVGHEAFARGVATGERRRAAAAIRSTVRPHATGDDRLVVTTGPKHLDALFAAVEVPDLVVRSLRRRGATSRRALEQALRSCALHDVPLLITTPTRRATPTTSPAQAPTPRASLTP